jgi:hypothetical protein
MFGSVSGFVSADTKLIQLDPLSPLVLTNQIAGIAPLGLRWNQQIQFSADFCENESATSLARPIGGAPLPPSPPGRPEAVDEVSN